MSSVMHNSPLHATLGCDLLFGYLLCSVKTKAEIVALEELLVLGLEQAIAITIRP